MKIKQVAELAIKYLTGEATPSHQYGRGMGGSSCIAVGRAYRELIDPLLYTEQRRYRAWDLWAYAAMRLNGGKRPDWWDNNRTHPEDISLRCALLQRWADEHGDKEFNP